jgi:hypothetical protein
MSLKRKGWGLGARDWGLGTGDEALLAAGASQHHSLNLICGSRKATHLGKEFFFFGTKRECV